MYVAVWYQSKLYEFLKAHFVWWNIPVNLVCTFTFNPQKPKSDKEGTWLKSGNSIKPYSMNIHYWNDYLKKKFTIAINQNNLFHRNNKRDIQAMGNIVCSDNKATKYHSDHSCEWV